MQSSQVMFPLTNTAIATALIQNKITEAFSEPQPTYSLSDASRAHIVDDFMRRHPRGKGVKGNEMLAEFYAACRTIKIAQSTPSKFRRGTNVKLNATEQKILRSFTGPEHILSRKGGEIKGSSKFYETLVEAGILNGLYSISERGISIVSAWMTDFGIRVRTDMISAQDRAAKMQRRASWFDDSGVPVPMRVLNYHLDRVKTLEAEIDAARDRKTPERFIENTINELRFHDQAVALLRDVADA